jgi:eukaryotic-like serine/threonine-protein kinase
MVGKQVLHYRIIEEVGRGGMGIVYKARDTRLDRDVALKFLPPHLSASAQDKARFIQEAKAAATLDHPNICTVYSIEEYEGQLFFAMQLVDGQLLRDRVSGLSEKQAIDIGIQIAEGLAAAHDKGIVHRDIKPENIMVRKDGIVQIMDFGLAKLKGVSRLTKEGSTVGTAGYMSPEQVQGLDADHRSDIFSLGVLLYEMFTGELPFKGVHETAVAYEIVNVDAPPMASARPGINPALDAIILECLEKDPRERTQSASQIAVDLKRYKRESSRQRASMVVNVQPVAAPDRATHANATVGEPPAPEAKYRVPRWAATAAVAAAMLGLGYGVAVLTSRTSTPAPVIRASIEMPQGVRYYDALGGHSAISPDGSAIAFVGVDSLSQQGLWVRPMNTAEARHLAGTTSATYPFWSPEGTSIGFFADGKLKTIDARGGPAIALADAPFGRGGTWNRDGDILFTPNISDPNLYVVPATGGDRRQVTAFDSTQRSYPRYPSFLPDGDHFVFTMLQSDQMRPTLYVSSLKDMKATVLAEGAAYGMAASGYLMYLRQGILIAQRFDQSSRTLVGRPLSLQDNINAWAPRAKADYSVSESGVLIYAGGRTALADEAIWIAADGSETTITQASISTRPVLSPDRTRFLFDETQNQRGSIWIYDLGKKTRTRITFDPEVASFPCWSSDGSRVFFNIESGARKAIIGTKPSDGSGATEVITQGEENLAAGYYPIQASPDGRYLLIQVLNESRSQLATIDLHDKQRPIPVTLLSIAGGTFPRDHNSVTFSPDGKWLAYEASESGTNAIYISPSGGQPGKWQVSPEGAMNPMWTKGKIVYWSTSLNHNEWVEVKTPGGAPVISAPKQVFPNGKAQNNMLYGTSADGTKFLAMRRLNSGSGSSLYVVVNWQGLLNER